MRPAAALLALLVAATIAVPAVRAGGSGAAPLVPQPVLGVADADMKLMGASSADAGSEAWAYRQLPLSASPPAVGAGTADFGPADCNPERQLAFLRYTAATGWRITQTPVDAQGVSYRGPNSLNQLSARVTPRGGGLLLGRDTTEQLDTTKSPPACVSKNQQVVLMRDPDGRFRALPEPPADVLLPGQKLASEETSGRVADAAVDENGRTGAFFAAIGNSAETAVLHFDGEHWSREPVQAPAGSDADFKVIAISATSPDNAWLLARADPATGRGLVLMQRLAAGGPRWVERDLGASVFARRATPAAGVDEVEGLGGAAQPLTATSDGVWLDGSLRASADGGVVKSFTAYYDIGESRITGSWCDAHDLTGGALCGHSLGARLSTQIGYRSFAWAGDGFGTRVITDPLEPEGGPFTNNGTYLSLEGDAFVRMPGAGGNVRSGGAFVSPDEGWLDGPVHITRSPEPQQLRDSWPVSLRAPLTSVAGQPDAPPGDPGAAALAVGADGGVLRYQPGSGWVREFLLSANGSVVRNTLRAVAWPEPSRAYAVGDLGAMWLWRSDTGLWERDPAAPVGFEGNLLGVAFDPRDANRGYAVGRAGTLLRYGKTWEQEQLPPGFGGTDLTQIAFAGREAIAVAYAGTGRPSDLLVNDGSGWRVDGGARDLLRSLPGNPQLYAVAGLPDGGAVAAGRDVVIERDSAGAPWRFSGQPLPGSTVIAAAALREGPSVRAVVSVQPSITYPPPDNLPVTDPNQPQPILPPFPLPADGYVLRETAAGWRDEQHTAFAGSSADRPIKSDPVLAFDVDSSGSGWAVGGWSGERDSAGRGASGRNATGKQLRELAQTAGVYRYGGGNLPPPGAGAAGVPLDPGTVSIAVAGHAQCQAACADLRDQSIGPDRRLAATLSEVAALRGQPGGPRLLAYTGGRLPPGSRDRSVAAETARYAELLGSSPGLPVFSAVSEADSTDGAASFRQAFAGFDVPFGAGASAPGVSATGIPGVAPAAGARTHYAFDSAGPGGALRLIVIDNSKGSLEASDPYQNPAEPQRPWLTAVLADAATKGIASIVVGSRDLNTRFTPRLNVASDGAQTAQQLVDGGASAYLFERPEENRAYRIPSGGARTIPSFGTGTLGYRSSVSDPSQPQLPDALFGDSGFLVAQVDVAHRSPTTNQAPVSVRMIPILEDLSLQAVDGTLLRRSRPSLFQGLGRRPLAGDRWGDPSPADNNPTPGGSDSYTAFPPAPCRVAGCSTRIEPEYQFLSSDPDIADFVRQDPNSTNLRKPFLGPGDKVVSDARSSLLCPFNAGTTTITVSAGGRAYSQVIRVLPGSVQRPCGTRPLRPDRFKRPAPGGAAAPPPAAPQQGGQPPVSFSPPNPPPAPTPIAKATAKPPSVPALPPAPQAIAYLPPVPLPFPPPAVRPSPPGGGMGRAYQVERQREDEVAPEESQAFARYHPDDRGLPPGFIAGLILIAALAGATIRGGPRAGGARAAPSTVSETRRRT